MQPKLRCLTMAWYPARRKLTHTHRYSDRTAATEDAPRAATADGTRYPCSSGMACLLVSKATVRGQTVADILRGSWRLTPPLLDVPADMLADVVPLLTRNGSAGLAWWRIQHSRISHVPQAEELRLAYRAEALRAALHVQSIRATLSQLRSAGIEPVVIKGWSTARLYPKPGLRPYVDLDLVVPPGLSAQAEAIVKGSTPFSSPDSLDILDGATWANSASGGDESHHDLADRRWDVVMERTRLVPLGDLQVRVLGPEDHLRLSAVHAFRHGFLRPKWLCDIGLLMETVPNGFDFKYCFAGSGRNTERLLRALGLAHVVLGADARHCPRGAADVPPWLVGSVVRRWGTPLASGPGPSITRALRDPRILPGELYRRWPDPLESTLRHNLSLTEQSRLAAQTYDFVWRSGVLPAARRLRPAIRRPSR